MPLAPGGQRQRTDGQHQEQPAQLGLFVADNALADAVDALQPDELTPKQALEALYRLKQLR